MVPKLSILIPTRNRARYVTTTIATAKNIRSDDIEIIISENYSDDDTWERVRHLGDRLTRVIRPPRPLSMHENFEYLLQQSTGEWVTFLGDDDAICPYVYDVLIEVERQYRWCEVIYSTRAYFFWPNIQDEPGTLRFSMGSRAIIERSSSVLEQILSGQLNYLYGPQVYSGGFHRRTLINRTCRLHGSYFTSTIPDASSIIAALSNTVYFLRVGIPLSLVGTSPSRDLSGDEKSSKNRDQDFYDRLPGSGNSVSPLLPPTKSKEFFGASACFYFLEAYLNSPFKIQEKLADGTFQKLLISTIIDLDSNGHRSEVDMLLEYFNFERPSTETIDAYRLNYPKIVPDPLASSVTYMSNGNQRISNIAEAVQAVDDVFRSTFAKTGALHEAIRAKMNFS